MSEKLPAVKGMQDVLPPDAALWQRVEAAARRVFALAGFGEFRAPVLEYTPVFVRSIGEVSDIVEKEMYTFEDKGGRSVTMRPEGTAGVVRSYVQLNLHTTPSPQKYYYMGPMFRYERPQKGRLRQFHQIGAEAFGDPGPMIDAEMAVMLVDFLSAAGLGGLSLEVNSIGCPDCRPAFREALVAYFSARRADLCEDCARRLTQNPLRILDCKARGCSALRPGAPAVTDYHCEGCAAHFAGFRAALDAAGVAYRVNPEMVRGLDYYTRTTFEILTDRLGAQSAVAAGGRYDRLVSEFGGPPTPAIGFAVGMERIVALLAEDAPAAIAAPVAFIASMGEAASCAALSIARSLRAEGYAVELGYGSGSLKAQMRRADRSGAAFAFVIGDQELERGLINWKSLRGEGAGEVSPDDLPAFLASRPG
jgi:histidyl-tRNA synthetase